MSLKPLPPQPCHDSTAAVSQSCPTLCNPMDCSPPGPSVCGMPRQEHWSGVPCPPPRDPPDQGLNPGVSHCRRILYCPSLGNQGTIRHGELSLWRFGKPPTLALLRDSQGPLSTPWSPPSCPSAPPPRCPGRVRGPWTVSASGPPGWDAPVSSLPRRTGPLGGTRRRSCTGPAGGQGAGRAGEGRPVVPV